MKQGWQIYKLEDICTIYDKLRKPISKKDRVSGIYPYYGASCVQDYVNDYLFDGRYVLIGEDGAKWGSGEDTAYIVEGKFWVNNHAHIIQCNNGIVDTFIYYYFNHLDLTKLVAGAIIPKLTQETLRSMEIPIPPLSEQQRIVALLDAEFAKIDALKANAEKNLQNAKNLFQAALKKELEPKEGWKTKRIEEIAEIKGGKRVPKGYKLITEKTPHPYIRVSDFNDNGSVDLGDIHYIEDWVYKEIQRYTISFKDVYISIAGTIGKSGIIPKELEGANLTENACKLVLNQGLYNRYVYYCTINEPFKSQIVKLTMQAAQPKLALTRLATATISIPSLEDQQSIVARLDVLNDKCKTLQANYEMTLSLCDDLKQALLRKAFNGEI